MISFLIWWYILGVIGAFCLGVYCDKGMIDVRNLMMPCIVGLLGPLHFLLLFIMILCDHGDKYIIDLKKVKYIKKLWGR